MAQFFINRPILAWVIAIFIMIAGLISLPFMPVAQYPKVAPPQLTISTAYPGASPQEIYQGVTRQIEDELNGVDNLAYFESTSDTSGSVSITVTFNSGTDLSQATVVTLYLLSSSNLKLRPILTRQLKPGTRIVAHNFAMGDWEAEQIDTFQDQAGRTRTLYRWTTDGKVRQ